MAAVVTLSRHHAGQISSSGFEFVVRGPFFFLESGRRLQLVKDFWTDPRNSEHLFSFDPPPSRARL